MKPSTCFYAVNLRIFVSYTAYKKYYAALIPMDEKELERLYLLYHPRIRRWIRKYFAQVPEADVEDILQDTFVAYFLNVRQGRYEAGKAKLETYLIEIAKHKLLNFQKARRIELSWEGQPLRLTVENEALAQYKAEEIVFLMQKVVDISSESCYRLLHLFYVLGKKMEDIAQELGLSNAHSAKTKKRACLKTLQAKLKTHPQKDTI